MIVDNINFENKHIFDWQYFLYCDLMVLLTYSGFFSSGPIGFILVSFDWALNA